MFAPTREQILSDLIIGLKRFRNTVRWKWFFLEEKRKKNEIQNSPLSQNALDSNFSFENYSDENDENVDPNIKTINEGLKSGLTPEKTIQDAPIGSPEVESFIKEVEQQLVEKVSKIVIRKSRINNGHVALSNGHVTYADMVRN